MVRDDEVSDDPIMNQYGTPSDEDDFIEYDDRPPPRRTRQSKPTRRSTRNSNRRHDSEDEFGAPKRQLRQRTSKPNYELPPLDISAELMQEAITNVAGPSLNLYSSITRLEANVDLSNILNNVVALIFASILILSSPLITNKLFIKSFNLRTAEIGFMSEGFLPSKLNMFLAFQINRFKLTGKGQDESP